VNLIRVSLGLSVLFLGYGLIELACIFLFSGVFDVLFSFLICERKFVKPKIELDYNATSKLRSVPSFILASFKNVAFSGLSRFFESSTKSLEVLYESSFKYLLSLALPITVEGI
jgi:hypothetical protein